MQVKEQYSIKEQRKLEPEQWVSNYADYLYAFAMQRFSDEDLARDLVQDTFLAALESMANYEGNASEKTWLTSILKHKIYDLYRKQSSGLTQLRMERRQQEDDNFFEKEDGHWIVAQRPASMEFEINNMVETKELRQILEACIKKLPTLWKSAFSMKFMDEECAEKICLSLNLSNANYWVIIHRTKLNLRACLQKFRAS